MCLLNDMTAILHIFFEKIPNMLWYSWLSLLMFSFALAGMFFSRKHILILFISLELLLLSVNVNLVVFSVFLEDLMGQILALLVLGVAAAESALGLAILIVFYRLRGSISIDVLKLLKS